MGRRRKYYSAELIVTKLREAEVLLSQGKTISEASKVLEISEQTYYRWRREYGGMDTSRAKKFKELENENKRLKNLVADLSLDNAILGERFPLEDTYMAQAGKSLCVRHFNQGSPFSFGENMKITFFAIH